ncbi:MAG: GTP-binding protein [Myxococcota bacterium]
MSGNVPVLLLTGFLGSGKTTLLNRLMTARPQTRGKLAIVVNEFGEVGIDGDLLPSEMTRQVELPGGCICCILNEDLDKTLCELLDTTPDIDTIIIETTGVAEPLPISWSLGREPLSERVRLAAVITVVDSLEFERSRPISPAVDGQVEYADILVMSKLDLLGGAPPDSLRTALEQLNPEAIRITGSPEYIVEQLWRTIADPHLPAAAPVSAHRTAAASKRASGSGPGPGQSAHDFETVWLPIENLIDFEDLSSELEELPKNYVRIKGIARVIDGSTGSSEPRWVAFHRVGTRVSCEVISGPLAKRLVALGHNLDRECLAACLRASVVPLDQ